MNVFMLALMVLIPACGSPATLQDDDEVITISEMRIGNHPNTVIPYAGGDFYKLAGLEASRADGSLSFSLPFERLEEGGEIVVMVYLVRDGSLMLVNTTDAKQVIEMTPPGESGGDIAVIEVGYSIESVDSQSGSIGVSIPTAVNGLYDLSNGKVTAFAFLQDGSAFFNVKNGSYMAMSNVVKTELQ